MKEVYMDNNQPIIVIVDFDTLTVKRFQFEDFDDFANDEDFDIVVDGIRGHSKLIGKF